MPVAIIPDIMDESSETAAKSRGTGSCSMEYNNNNEYFHHQAHPHSSSWSGDDHGMTMMTAAARGGSATAAAAAIASAALIRRDREREGRCADCGVQTHEVSIDPFTSRTVKRAMSVEGEVHRGRCLLCYPILVSSVNHQQEQQQLAYQQQGTDTTVMDTEADIDAACAGGSSNFPPRRLSQSSTGTFGGSPPSWEAPLIHQALAVLQHQHQHFGGGGGVDIVDILAAMKRVPGSSVVQELGCERLWILSWEDENAAAVGTVGGIPIVLAAMARFPTNQRLQLSASQALQNLAAVSNANRAEMCDLGGVPLIVQAMMRHLSVAAIQQCGCTALASLAAASSTCATASVSTTGNASGCSSNFGSKPASHARDHRQIIQRAGGFHAIIIAARHFAHDESVLSAAYDALSALGYDPVGRLPPYSPPGEQGASRPAANGASFNGSSLAGNRSTTPSEDDDISSSSCTAIPDD